MSQVVFRDLSRVMEPLGSVISAWYIEFSRPAERQQQIAPRSRATRRATALKGSLLDADLAAHSNAD